ncbi:MAG: isoprenyl transferase [Proteobacteria bacterium]|nr:isoprenyl transferase [Pseudomonadota bacterium]
MPNQKLPKHIAIVMDGNGRWAQQQHKPRVFGHRAGVQTVREIVKICAKKQIEVLSLFAFSSENWSRPQREVNFILNLFLEALNREVHELNQNNIRIYFVGDQSPLKLELRQKMQQAEELTRNNTGLKLVIAVNYGGQWDILQAVQKIARQVETGNLKSTEIDFSLLNNLIGIAGLPQPDLFIRTSGEQRISNFFLWQLAYTELYFTDTPWPEFREEALEQALAHYNKKQRRFGKTSEQIKEYENA